MEQGTDIAKVRIGFIGTGRLGKSLALALHAKGLAVTACASWVVYCTGAIGVAALETAACVGGLTGGLRLLHTFGDPRAAAASLPCCTITD
jgi:hypothetical protein